MGNSVQLQKIIAAYCALKYNEVDLKVPLENNYIPTAFKDDFCSDICKIWKSINCTDLHNNMFGTIKTGEDILKTI
jgi:hypothetical protein